MKLEVFEATVQTELKLLRKTTLLIGSLFICIFGFVLFDKHEFYFNSGDFIKERDLGASICYESFMSIINKTPSSDLITPSILNELKTNEFHVVVEDVLGSFMVEANKCQLITKSNEGIRTFLISLEADRKFKHYYKLSSIDELELSTTLVDKLIDKKEN